MLTLVAVPPPIALVAVSPIAASAGSVVALAHVGISNGQLESSRATSSVMGRGTGYFHESRSTLRHDFSQVEHNNSALRCVKVVDASHGPRAALPFLEIRLQTAGRPASQADSSAALRRRGSC